MFLDCFCMHPWKRFQFFLTARQTRDSGCFVLHRQKRMMGMTLNEAQLIDVERHYHTDRIPMEMKEKSVAENLLDKMSETQLVILSSTISC